jgi:hypothetical protein
MKLKILLLVISVAVIVNSGYACTCGGEDSPRIRYDRAKVVFTGTVIEVSDKAVKLRVEKAYKGNIAKEFLLTRRDQETTCDIFFNKGDKYLVYAYEVKLGVQVAFMTDVCAGTDSYDNSREGIKYLEAPDPFPNLGELVAPKDKKARPKHKPKIKKQ